MYDVDMKLLRSCYGEATEHNYTYMQPHVMARVAQKSAIPLGPPVYVVCG